VKALARSIREPRQAWWALVGRLDRPGRRWLLAAPASVWVSVSRRTPCLVSWQSGAWVHHYRGAKIPHAVLGRAAPPAAFTAEARDLFLYEYTPRAGDSVFDVGAGIGAETFLFSRLAGPTGRVVSLEAHPRTYERLTSLCRANGLANVTALQIAASDTDGELAISDYEHYLHNTIVVGDAAGITVPARRLDSVARDLGITRIDLLKMNIEGAERVAIRGLDHVIDDVRHVCISCHDFLADDGGREELRTRELVREYLLTHGFRVSTRDDAPEPWTRDYVYGAR
jgi:FkbM family methyltransferase